MFFCAISTLFSCVFVQSAVSNSVEPESRVKEVVLKSCCFYTKCANNEVVALHLFQYDFLLTRREFPSPDLQTYREKM